MNLIKQKELKNKMLEVNPSFMRKTFDSGIDRAREARKEMEYYLENLKNNLNDKDAMELERATNTMALGINHAAFTYDPNDPHQVITLNDIMEDANNLIQGYGEYLNTIIHNYPNIERSFDHIYDIADDYYSVEPNEASASIANNNQVNQAQEMELQNQAPEPTYNNPSLEYGPRPGF